jgi:hypothetical protein
MGYVFSVLLTMHNAGLNTETFEFYPPVFQGKFLCTGSTSSVRD